MPWTAFAGYFAETLQLIVCLQGDDMPGIGRVDAAVALRPVDPSLRFAVAMHRGLGRRRYQE